MIIGSLVDVVDPVLQNFYPIVGEMIYMTLKRKEISSLWFLFEALTINPALHCAVLP